MLEMTGVIEVRNMRAQYLTGWTSSASAHHDQSRTSAALARPRPRPHRHRLVTSTSPTRCRGRSPPARAPCCWSTPAQASRRRRSPTLYLALENDLHVIRVLTRSTCGRARDRYAAEIPTSSAAIVRRAAGERQERGGRERAAHVIVRDIRRRSATPMRRPRADDLDSVYDILRGVITYIRVVDGHIGRAAADTG